MQLATEMRQRQQLRPILCDRQKANWRNIQLNLWPQRHLARFLNSLALQTLAPFAARAVAVAAVA